MSNQGVHLVVQRYRSCKLLINETKWVSIPPHKDHVQNHCGLLVYVSFSQTDKEINLKPVAEAILNLPVLTTGHWGDGVSSTLSINDLVATDAYRTSIALVPQANLICKMRGSGKQIQYHGQIDKDNGQRLYQSLLDHLRDSILELQCKAYEQPLPDWYHRRQKLLAATQSSQQWSDSLQCQPPSSTPPEHIFRDESKYSAWDDDGIPIKDISGESLAKNATKKLRKIQEAHRKRHGKWRAANPDSKTTMALIKEDAASSAQPALSLMDVSERQWSETLDDAFCQLVAGTFGKRQGLEIHSDMGPFCHIFQI